MRKFTFFVLMLFAISFVGCGPGWVRCQTRNVEITYGMYDPIVVQEYRAYPIVYRHEPCGYYQRPMYRYNFHRMPPRHIKNHKNHR